MCYCDKYASLGKEKRRQQAWVSPLHREKKLDWKQSDGKHSRILSWGKSAQSSLDFMVPVYISWGHCQHSNSMKFCCWLAPFNSVAYVKQNLTCSLTAGDGYFILQILSTLLGTMWPKWKNGKNLKPAPLQTSWYLDLFLFSLFFFFKFEQSIWRYSQTGFCHS